jgi:membrane-associated protease RseP (regulator of RpoE activity)
MIGIQLKEKDGQFYVYKVFKNSPAERAGLKEGDLFLRVGEQDLSGYSLAQVLKLFDGNPMTEVEVAILRGGMEIPPVRINRISPRELIDKSPDFKDFKRHKPPSPSAKAKPTPAKKDQDVGFVRKDELNNEQVKAWQDYLGKIYGFRAVLLDEKFGEKLGALFHEGILVLDVKVGTPAFKAGLEKWDLIYRIEGITPKDYFKKNQPPPESSGALPLELTLLGLTGEKEVKL